MPDPSSVAHAPLWLDSAPVPRFPPLASAARADVVVVGGGVTGLTTAYLLASAGKSVIVLERGRLAEGDTGFTTAHLTMVTDMSLRELVSRYGRTHAQAVWDGGLAAIEQIDQTIREHGIECGFAWTDGYLHAPLSVEANDRDSAAARFAEDAALAGELGFDAEFVADVPLVHRCGIRFEGQARFHPRRYLAGVAAALIARGGRIFEHTEAHDFAAEPLSMKANGHTVSCGDIVLATHDPLVGISGSTSAMFFQTKLALYTSYVLAGRVGRREVPDAMWWEQADPYHYLRLEPGVDHNVVIFGGEDHKTGQSADTEACYARLEATLRGLIPEVELTHRWSGQIIETPDGLPYIGPTAEHQYVATGFCGNGFTFGTLGAMATADAILGRTNPWAELLAPGRKALGRSFIDYVKENADYPYYMMRSRFAGQDGRPLRSLKRGEGRVIERDGKPVAAYRGPDGSMTLRSAVCTHMGCTVGWNAAERTWDCPCHGSRFTPQGEVIGGPAETPLAEPES